MLSFRKFRILVSVALLPLTLSIVAQTVKDLPVKEINGKRYYYYQAKGKETLYSIAHKLNLTQEQIIEFNPTAYEGISSKTVLYFPTDAFGEAVAEDAPTDARRITTRVQFQSDQLLTPSATQQTNAGNGGDSMVFVNPKIIGVRTHLVERGETIYGIAKQYGITTEALMEANPAISSGLKAGMVITVPYPPGYDGRVMSPRPPVESAQQTEPSEQNTNTSNEPVSSSASEVRPSKSASINIAVLLPFDLDAASRDKESTNYLEFYKGFLMAVDTLRDNGVPIHITTLDIGTSQKTVADALKNPALESAQVIIAPSDKGNAMSTIAKWGAEHGVPVFNLFDVKDESYTSNPVMIQANVPHDVMFEKAAKGFISRYRGFHPVFIKAQNTPKEKTEFQDYLASSLNKAGIKYTSLTYVNEPDDKTFSGIDLTSDIVVVPAQGSQRELNRLLAQLNKLPENESEITIFGYPEWITYRGETKDNLHKLGATYYSRFIDDAEDRYTQKVLEAYKSWYGGEISGSVPRPGVMGFDTGMYILRALKATKGNLLTKTPSYQGVQNGFKFTQTPGGGFYNERIFLVTLRPSGMVDYKDL